MWRVEDVSVNSELTTSKRAGSWGSMTRDGNLITGQQNFSGGETARLVIETLGR